MSTRVRTVSDCYLRAARCRRKEGLDHVPVVELQLRQDHRRLIYARRHEGRAERSTSDYCRCHGMQCMLWWMKNTCP
jgi:hypothetical protein